MENPHEHFMRLALENAKKAWGQTHPNPMVGAVIVRDGRILSQGFHEHDGGLHAERNAINALQESAKGADIYVTLEPCSTHGRTGACTDAIISSGISRVFIGSLDPNPLHAGRALEVLKQANIECFCGILKDECEELNIIFNHSITTKRALLAIKVAQTKNGKIAEVKGKPSFITERSARENAHLYRKLFPAIAVGFGTLLSDNPSLTSRLNSQAETCPVRFIFDRSLKSCEIELSKFKVFSDSFKDKTYIVCDSDSDPQKIEKLKSQKINILQIPTKRNEEKLFWQCFKEELFKMRLTGVIIEGGSQILTSLINTQEADYFFEYTSPKIFDDSALNAYNAPRPKIVNPKIENLAPDTLLHGFITY